MVFALIIFVALIATAFTFRGEIKGFVADLRKESTPQEVERQERGAVQNTQAFILGEKGLADLQKTSEENKLLINKFIRDSQTQIDQAIVGVNTTLADAQKNLESFAQQSQENIVKAQDEVSTAFTQAGTSVTEFFGAIPTNIQSFFGGQTAPKAIATSIPQSPDIEKPKGGGIDLSFLSSVETLEGQGSKLEETALIDRQAGRRTFG